jgi:hypothetical protein
VCRKDPRRNHAQYNREGNTTIPASTADILGEDMPHKIIIITPEYRQSAKLFFQSSELGLPHPPHPQASVASPFGSGGRGTLACCRGGGGVSIPTRGHTLWLWYSVYVCIL